MSFTRVCTSLIGALALISSTFCFAGDGSPLRYKLQAGIELIYRGSSTSESTKPGAAPAHKSNFEQRYIVSQTNADGSWHLVCLARSLSTTDGEPKTPSLAEFDLSSDGNIRNQNNPMQDFTEQFPLLSDTPLADWQQHKDTGDQTVTYHASPSTQPSELHIQATTDGMFARIYLIDQRANYRFDTQRGLIVHTDSTVDQRLYHDASQGTLELIDEKQLPIAQAANVGEQVHAVLQAQHDYRHALAQAKPDAMDKPLEILTQAQAHVTLAELTPILAASIAQHPQTVKMYQSDQDSAQDALVGKPAPPWDLPDLNGKHHTLAEQRGKVVVIDFWYRGCGWCMRAMPNLIKLSNEYNAKPVAFFGMNVDSDDNDARFVADYFKLPYPTLRTHFARRPSTQPSTQPADDGPAATYSVNGYPTLFIIDPSGNVSKVEVGYSDDMHDKLAKLIDALLPQQTARGG